MGRHKLKVIEKAKARLPPLGLPLRRTRSSSKVPLIEEPVLKKQTKRDDLNPSISSSTQGPSTSCSLPPQNEQQKQAKDKDKTEDDSRNSLEKIIKLDKKHSNFDLYDCFANNLLKVRSLSYQINYQQVQGLSQTDHQMRQFWRHINSMYMRKLNVQDENCLDYFKNVLNQPIDNNTIVEVEWEDWNVQLAVLKLLDDSLQRQFPSDDEISLLNYENLLNHIRITFLIGNKFVTDKTLVTKVLAMKRKSIPKNTSIPSTPGPSSSTSLNSTNAHPSLNKESYLSTLESERDTLLEIVNLIRDRSTLAKEIESEFDYLGQETEQLIQSLKLVNKENSAALHKLEDKMRLELSKGQMVFLETVSAGNSRVDTDVNMRNKEQVKQLVTERNLSKLDAIQVQRDFLFATILRLEKQQLAESISCVTGFARKDKLTDARFEVRFEYAYNDSPQFVPESLLDELNSLREQNLFSFYNIPQKTLFSHIANNSYGLSHIQKTRTKLNPLRQTNLKDLIVKKDAAANRMDDFDTCHHCKHLFQDSILLSCNYNASTMGLPIYNYVITDPFLYNQTEAENQTSKKPHVNKHRNCFTMFQRVDGDLVCQRKYCRSCLKQNYDLILADIKDKPDWVCPFCQGNCYCTRCLRNELLMKYKGIYMLLGGDINQVQRESVFEYYSQQSSIARSREMSQLQANLSKGSKGYAKGMRLREEKQSKHSEGTRLRALSLNACKREKCKFELIKHDIDIFREKYAAITGKEFAVIDPTTYTTVKLSKKEQQNSLNHSRSMLTLDSMPSDKLRMPQISQIFKKKNASSSQAEQQPDLQDEEEDDDNDDDIDYDGADDEEYEEDIDDQEEEEELVIPVRASSKKVGKLKKKKKIAKVEKKKAKGVYKKKTKAGKVKSLESYSQTIKKKKNLIRKTRSYTNSKKI